MPTHKPSPQTAPIVRTRFVADRNSVGFAREKALTISFVERGFGRLGLDRQAVGFSWCSYKFKFSFTPGVFLLEVGWEALVFGHFSQPPSLGYLFFLLYLPAFIVLRPRIGSTFPRLILVPSAHIQSRWGWL